MEKSALTIIKGLDTFNMVISKNLENKIRYLCNKIFNVEWSGALFYTYSGSFENKDLTITGVDLILLDVGTSTYTEFDMSPKVIAYMTEHPELLDCQIGLIHSHNQMATFFSSTDLQTLKEEGIDRNHFVSLIVNNEGTYTAAVTRKISSTKEVQDDFSYKTFEDNIKKGIRSYKVEEDYILYNYLTIAKETDSTNFTELETQIKEVKKDKQNRTTQVNNTYPMSSLSTIPKTTFPKVEDNRQTSFDFSNSLENYYSYDPKVTVNKDTVKSLAMQLITGSILTNSNTNINLQEWLNKMEQTFDKRFTQPSSFSVWCATNIEFILSDAVPDEHLKDQDNYICNLAIEVYDFISKLKMNKYLQIILDELEEWMVKL